MLFNSMNYLVFFPIVTLLYYIFPQKIRKYWLLIASYYFYMSWNAKYALLILFSTVVTYISAMVLERVGNIVAKSISGLYKKGMLVFCIAVNFGMLFYFKYSNFAIDNINILLQKAGLEIRYDFFDIILPVGISFFTFQAIGYLVDVYRGEIKAEKNFIRYALFISFFPQLVAGPIERSKNLLKQIQEESVFDVENVRNGLLTMAYGLFMKIVVADNIAAAIDPVFANVVEYNGRVILVAVILFAFQIYCDFNGYTQIAIGSARVLGLKLSQNFDSPYLGVSVKDFWRRWHISLTSWFRDYLYIPLGGSKSGKIKKQINTMIVYLCSGLWHGAAWHFVVWGGLNGLFSILEDLMKPFRSVSIRRLKINDQAVLYKVFQRIVTFILVDFAWLFFRASDMQSAIYMIKRIFDDFRLAWYGELYFISIIDSPYDFMVIVISLCIVFGVDLAKYRGIDVVAEVFKQQIIFRWIIYSLIVFMILYWGHYGGDYAQTGFIYFQF